MTKPNAKRQVTPTVIMIMSVAENRVPSTVILEFRPVFIQLNLLLDSYTTLELGCLREDGESTSDGREGKSPAS